ncbi:MAG: helicase associated domain-containing protein [Nitrospirae bacterium]|nr:helicase associated domain-containing protein [Nitrospirota bacterium]
MHKQEGLPPELINALEWCGFQWHDPCNIDDFETGYSETLGLYMNKQDPNVGRSYKTEDGLLLGRWQDKIRSEFAKGALDEYKIKKLKDIGFKRRKLRASPKEAFERGVEETIEFKERLGKADAPCGFKTLGGYPLGEWQAHQRRAFNKGKLSLGQIQKLEQIGFKFCRTKNEAIVRERRQRGRKQGVRLEALDQALRRFEESKKRKVYTYADNRKLKCSICGKNDDPMYLADQLYCPACFLISYR